LIPRPVVVGIVIVLTGLLVADVGGQFIIPGHTASPVVSGAILAILGGVVAASRGPKPGPPEPSPPATAQHRAPEEGP
jgi:hypothetical protein